MAAYKPQDATTNPTLMSVYILSKATAKIRSLNATKVPACQKLMNIAVSSARKAGGQVELRCAIIDRRSLDETSENAMDYLLVEFGREILNIVPGRVSTEIDAAFSFDKGV